MSYEFVESVFRLISETQCCTDRVCRIQGILRLYEYLVDNPECISQTPLFLEQTLLNVPAFQRELEVAREHIDPALYTATTRILQEFLELIDSFLP